MNRSKALSFLSVLLFAVLSASSCSGPKTTVTCPGGNCGGSTNALSITLRDSPPTGVSVLSFAVTISAIQLTPSTGSAVSLTLPANPYTVELSRLQSDSTFVGSFTATAVPAGTYTSVVIGLSSASVVFSNGNGVAAVGCAATSICSAANLLPKSPITITPATSIQIPGSPTAGISIDFNLNDAFTVVNNQLVVDFTQVGALSVVKLPLTGTPSNTLDLIEDFTGTASVSGSVATITSAARGTLVATSTSNTTFNDPLLLCGASAGLSCMASKTVSVDASLNTDGTMSLLEVDFLDSPSVDEVEGILLLSPTPGQFFLVLSDRIIVSQNSVLAGSPIGTVLNFTLANNGTFLIDSKDLNLTSQAGFASASDFLDGQQVMIHVQSATSVNNLISVVTDQARLRFSRFTATVVTPGPAFTIDQTTLPIYLQDFVANPQVQTYGTLTNFEGITDSSSLANGNLVSVRALLLNGIAPPFHAAKVRLQQ